MSAIKCVFKILSRQLPIDMVCKKKERINWLVLQSVTLVEDAMSPWPGHHSSRVTAPYLKGKQIPVSKCQSKDTSPASQLKLSALGFNIGLFSFITTPEDLSPRAASDSSSSQDQDLHTQRTVQFITTPGVLHNVFQTHMARPDA